MRYLYPDGSEKSEEPTDGTLFCIWDETKKSKSVWQWDGYLSKWVNVTTSHPSGISSGIEVNASDYNLLNAIEKFVSTQ